MNVLVTGGSGFVGQYLMKELAGTSHNIAAIARNEIHKWDNVQVINGNLNGIKKFQEKINQFDPDVIIHLAWEGIPDYSESISRTNLFNSINFLEYILNNTSCKKILVSGSCWEYGKKKGACKESDPVNINSYFIWAKHSLHQYLSVKCANKNVTLNWFRIFYVYGSGQREESLIPTLIKSIGANETPRINTPRNKNDFIYVEDVAKAFNKAIDVDLESGVYNLGSRDSASVYDICRMVEKHLLGTKTISKKVLENGEKDETVNFWADMTKTKKALNILGVTQLKKGIELCIQSMQTAVPT
jgi:nucleoside-diphosphate-sugar epimerase